MFVLSLSLSLSLSLFPSPSPSLHNSNQMQSAFFCLLIVTNFDSSFTPFTLFPVSGFSFARASFFFIFFFQTLPSSPRRLLTEVEDEILVNMTRGVYNRLLQTTSSGGSCFTVPRRYGTLHNSLSLSPLLLPSPSHTRTLFPSLSLYLNLNIYILFRFRLTSQSFGLPLSHG